MKLLKSLRLPSSLPKTTPERKGNIWLQREQRTSLATAFCQTPLPEETVVGSPVNDIKDGQTPSVSHMPFSTLNDTRRGDTETWHYHAAVRDLCGCAIFEAQPFCEQWDVLHGTLRSEKLAEQSKQREHMKK